MQPLIALLGAGLSRNALGTVLLRGAFCALELLCGLVIARLCAASGYGVYALVVAWIALLGIPAAAGFDRLVIREVAMHRARGEWSLLRGLVDFSSRTVLLPSIAVALVVAVIAALLSSEIPPDTRTALQMGLIAVPLLAFSRVRQSALQGLGHVAAGQIPETLVQPLALLVLMGGLYAMPAIERSGLVTVALYAVSTLIACFVAVLMSSRMMPAAVHAAVPEYRKSSWIKGAVPFVWLLGLNVLVTKADTVLVGLLAGSTPAGVYRLASQLAMLVAFPLTCVSMAVAPSIAGAYAGGDVKTLQAIATGAARLVLLASAPTALALVVFGPILLHLFGPEFVAGYRPLIILSLAYLVQAASGTAGYLLINTRFENRAAAVFGIGAALNVIGNLILIPAAGIEGAAIVTGLSVIVVNVTFVVLARRDLGIHSTALPLRR
ncbi:MAG TPA: polysaccharide biosynthesis C-terminal domain-containing protein [Polyangiaceae bacterium]|nr:polysaccharide biosynthesis C-terminal domain-containing protein [Polyangiaceae bacterium]